MKEFTYLYQKYVDRHHPIRQIAISFDELKDERAECYDLFSNEEEALKDKLVQKSLVKIKDRYGKNAVFKGMNLLDKATGIARNKMVGGHNG